MKKKKEEEKQQSNANTTRVLWGDWRVDIPTLDSSEVTGSRDTFWIMHSDLGFLCHHLSLRNRLIIFLTRTLRNKTIVWVFYSGWVVARWGICKCSLEHSRNRVWNIRETGSGSFGIDERGSKWHSKNLVPLGTISKDLSIDLRSSTECCHAFPLRYDNICPISASNQG